MGWRPTCSYQAWSMTWTPASSRSLSQPPRSSGVCEESATAENLRAAAPAAVPRQYGRTGLPYRKVGVGCSGTEQSHMRRRPVMEKGTTFVAIDDSKRKMVVGILGPAMTEPDQRELPKEPHQIRRLFQRLRREGPVQACYEAGVSGYDL